MDIKQRIQEEQDLTRQVLEETKRLKILEAQRAGDNKDLENQKWNEFLDVIKDATYFRQKHIDDLKVPYHICIHLSAKGSGKTTELFRMMRKVIEDGGKFMYGRVYQNELDLELVEFKNDKKSPIYPITFKGTPYFFKKDQVDAWLIQNTDENGIIPTPTFKKLQQDGLDIVGRGYTFLKSNSLSGGSYEGYTHIFFDEILSYSPINRVNDKVLHAWSASIHTIQRNKPSLKVYMYGNLQNAPYHPILDFYGISIDDNLRIIQRGEKGKTVILYVNSGGHYLNTIGNKGGSAHHYGVEQQIFLKYNKVIKPTTSVLTPDIFNNMNFVTAFALKYLGDPYYVELRESTDENIYAISCGQLDISTLIEGEIYTNDPTIYNRFLNTTPRTSIEGVFNRIYRLFKYRELCFDTLHSLDNYNEIVENNQHMIYENQPNPNAYT